MLSKIGFCPREQREVNRLAFAGAAIVRIKNLLAGQLNHPTLRIMMGDQRSKQIFLGSNGTLDLCPMITNENGISSGFDADFDFNDVIEAKNLMRTNLFQPTASFRITK